ncbi:MAG: M61 family peptidase [Candidatus Eisenbacteria bacterium]|uniref:M61 family peptidase n=1 Tax=Eiseniibacteriota bacterium TaxID=2212470 RepID=A0A9D6L8X5_UNCEI|nr:M61 family peptidase [Candidatus Eisenbacteria bacterium]
MTLAVDATEAPRGLLHARLTVPVAAGRVTLVYPKWLPGEHGPTGPITDLVGFAFAGGGHALAWARDTVDMYAFHITVPAGVTEIAASYDFLLPAGGRFSSGVSSTPNLVLVSWNQVVLYPAGERSDDVRVTASLKIPAIWDFGTPLEIGHGSPSAGVVFKTVSLTTLVDSPVLAGRYFRSVRLNPGEGPPVYLDMAADSREALEIKPDQQAALSRLVGEAHTLFGVRHYRDYHFLCTLSDHTAHFGLEHHESSDDRMSERWLIDKDVWIQHSNLLPHEYTHSWNGKFRRPAGLATPDYQQPMRDELLWVYEGLTQYLGTVLGARSGVRDAATSRDAVAYAAANLDMHRGREWRPLLDTAVAAQLLYQASDAWQAMRRGTDFYNESIFIWLEADAIIRKASGGQRSLDDFCKTFHGGEDGRPMLKPYTFDDVVATLNAVQPHDWRAFLDARVSSIQPHPPLGGLEACGWKLGWADSLSAFEKVLEDQGKHTDMQYSIGLLLGEDGMIED